MKQFKGQSDFWSEIITKAKNKLIEDSSWNSAERENERKTFIFVSSDKVLLTFYNVILFVFYIRNILLKGDINTYPSG